jgi:hypothetical protein
MKDKTPLRRRTVLKTIGGTSVALGVGTGVTAAKRNGKGKKGGAGFTFTEPTVDTFTITAESGSSDETFQRGCGGRAANCSRTASTTPWIASTGTERPTGSIHIPATNALARASSR